MNGRRINFLIVDDSEDDRDIYTEYLTTKGYGVITASDGIEGLEKARQLQPQLILIDLWLPRMSGWEVLRRLKADERTKGIPVLVLTAHTSVQPRECEGFLTKPFPLDELDREIKRVITARPQ